MSRAWVTGTAALGGLIGATLGSTVTVVGCRPDSCVISAGIVAILAALVSAAGVGIVMTLVVRSLEEWRAAEAEGREPPSAGCETPET